MNVLVRLAAIAVAGVALYYAGVVNALVIQHPSRLGAAIVVLAVGASLALVVVALWRTSEPVNERVPSSTARVMRIAWLLISVMALVSLAWVYGVPRQRGVDWTPFHNDAIALNECAARALLAGQDPYSTVDLLDCYEKRSLGADRTTPVKRGAFSEVAIYPSDDELDRVWSRVTSGREARPAEFVSRPSYPALSFVLIAPWVALGWDTNVLYLLCLVAAAALVLIRAQPSLRPWLGTALLGSTSLVAFTIGGSADLLYALPLTAAWLWRERRVGAVCFGIACATKQLAWFFAPFYLLQVATASGRRGALRHFALIALVFGLANAPFVLADAGTWVAGVLTPVAEPLFPRGAGLVFLSTNGVVPLFPGAVYLLFEAAAAALALWVAWRERERSPELGAMLAVVPLFFAQRSLFSYFFLVPLFAFAGVTRLHVLLDPAAARAAGALTLFARKIG
ncbi:MAG: hypothetical protein HY071_06530 [Chloroflexi bacterium]|nr:hypothetical protein [Chloroflexota bacterium]